MSDLGLKIAELRRAKGLTQEQFAAKLNSSFQWVGQLEAGRNVTVHTLVKLANVLEVTLPGLLEAPVGSHAPAKRGRPKGEEAP